MRYFVNKMPDFVPGMSVKIDKARWKNIILKILDSILRHMPPTREHCDGGLYVGAAGVAYAYYYLASSETFADHRDNLLLTANKYMDVSLEAALSKHARDPSTSFLLGGAGVYAVGSLISSVSGRQDVSNDLTRRYQQLGAACQPLNFAKHGSDELFVGRAGYICGALLLNRHYQQQVISQNLLSALCASTIQSGQEYVRHHKSTSPLMYSYHGTEYLGAAHGLSAIILMLLSCPQFMTSNPDASAKVRGCIDYMLSLIQPNGNTPTALDEIGSHHRPESEELVHWCHGAPGTVYMFAKAYLCYKDDRYLHACLLAGELTWQKGLLRKGPGICHGVAGSGYVFLLLYRLTGDHRHLHRAIQFAEFMQTAEFSKARTPDCPYSLYEGLAGTVCFLVDVTQPEKAEFPFFDIFQ